MYEPVKFKNLKELVAELSAHLDDLNIGKLSREELERLTESGREVYERLVVLRFNAYSNEVKGTSPAASEPQISNDTPVFSIRIDEPKPEIPVNQVSLIDVIEEVIREEKPESVPAPAPESIPVVAEVPATPPVKEVSSSKSKQPEPQKEVLHEKLTRTVGIKESLAQKMESTPINDLKKAISLNQRFQFSKELFKGNNQDYEVSIDKLNTASREEAMKELNALKSRYTWNDESAIAQDFIGLVERRHT